MKKIIYIVTILTLICFVNKSEASVSSYVFSATTGTYVSIPSAGLLVNPGTEGANSTITNIGFTFKYDGINYTTFGASGLGFVKLGAVTTTEFNNNLSTCTNRPIIAPFFDDMRTGFITGGVFYNVTGVAPNRIMTAEWKHMRWWWSWDRDSCISFQVRLYETTNKIEFAYNRGVNYHNLSTGGSIGCSIGITSVASGTNNFISLLNTSASPAFSSSTVNDTISIAPATNQIYRFTPPPTGINQISSIVPGNFMMHQNYPNPFNPSTKIKLDIPNSLTGSQSYNLTVYDVSGKEVSALINQKLNPGLYEVVFDASNINSGVYFYKIVSESFTETKRMLVIK